MSKLTAITVQTSSGPQEIRATVVGPLAVHPSVGHGPIGQRAWSVTHRATGLLAAYMPQKRYAVALARDLAAAITFPDHGKVTVADKRTAARLIRQHRDAAFFAHCSL